MSNKVESLNRSLVPAYKNRELRDRKRSNKRLTLEILAVVMLVTIGLIAGCMPRDAKEAEVESPQLITVSGYMDTYKNEVGPIMYEEIGDPASEGLAKDLPGLHKLGYVTDDTGKASLMLLQFDSAANANYAKTEYGSEVQAIVRNNLMIVIDTDSSQQALTYLKILDHVR